MFADLLSRIRGAAPNLLALTEQETVLLEAWLDKNPEPPVYYDADYDAERRIGTMGEYTEPGAVDWWVFYRAVLKFNQSEQRQGEADSEPQDAPSAPPAADAVKSDVSLEARALAVFIEHQDWTKKRIAAHLGCNEKSLCPARCPKLAAAIAAQKSPIDPGRRRLHGSKDADGNLEAWEDE